MSLRHCRSVRINPARLSEEERFLPPGTMRDIWEQMVALEKGMKPVSFAQFWRVWKAEYPHLKFRSTSSHAICAVCTRHKMLLKEMGHHLRARSGAKGALQPTLAQSIQRQSRVLAAACCFPPWRCWCHDHRGQHGSGEIRLSQRGCFPLKRSRVFPETESPHYGRNCPRTSDIIFCEQPRS